MRKSLLSLLLGICFLPVFSQVTFTGALSDTDPVFDRPDEGMPPTTLSAIGTSVHYDVITINITTAGLTTINCNSVWDNFSILYGPGGFDPAMPLNNALVADDDLLGPNSGFTYNFTSTGVYYLVICSFKNDVTGAYSITQSAAVVLPLKLLSFTAAKGGGNTNIIKWSSEEERNLTAYEVQQSFDGSNFNGIKNGTIDAKNNFSATTTYSLTDNNPASGYNYYRLKITERSGVISYSNVALVKNVNLGISNLKVFPNPASDYLQIESKTMLNKKAFLSVISAAGVILQSGQYSFGNQALVTIDIKKLPAGKYLLNAIVDKECATMVFIKN